MVAMEPGGNGGERLKIIVHSSVGRVCGEFRRVEAGDLGGGAEEEVGAGDAEEEVGGPGGEDGGEGVDVAEGLEDAGRRPSR